MKSSSLKKARDQFDYYLKLANDKKEIDIPLLQYEFLDGNKENFLGELKMKYLFNSNNEIIGMQGVLRDITERIEQKQKLEKSYNELKELESIVNKSPGIIFLWKNEEGWPVEFVSENIDQFEYTSEEFYSQKVKYIDMIHPEDRERVAMEVQTHSDNGEEEFTQEYRILTKSGKCRWVDDRTWIRRNQNGEITHYQGIILNITKRKEMEKELKISEAKFRDAYSRSSFYKDLLAHDINNLLHTINSSAELILYNYAKTLGLEEFENLTDIIIEQVCRGKKLVKNVKLISELDAENLLKEPVNLNEIIKKAERFVKIAYDQKEINIQIENTIEKPIVLANEILQDVFENLFINSIKYNENETIEISLKILTKNIKMLRYIEVEIIDNGVGIPDYHKQVLFNRGNRYNEGSNGMGLGLSLVKKFIESFNGEIYVKNKVPKDYTKGTKFLIRLPRLD